MNVLDVGLYQFELVYRDCFRKVVQKKEKGVELIVRARKINCVMRLFLPSSSVGDRPAPRGCTSTPDERKVTTI